jgi:hypothetical protein
MSTGPKTDVEIQIEYDDRFERRIEAGKPFADTGIRMHVGDTVLAGTDDDFLVSEFVVTLCRKLCDAVEDIVAGRPVEVPFHATSYAWTFEPAGDGAVRVTSSSEEASPPVERRALAEVLVQTAEELLAYIYDTNPRLEDHAQIKELRESMAEAREILDGNA